MRIRRRAELLHVLPERQVQHLHRPERRRPAGRDLHVPVQDADRPVLPRQHAADRGRRRGTARRSASGKTPIDNIGPRFNGFVGVKNYEAAAEKTIVHKGGVSIFAGQRDDPFFADVGAIFDLVAIRKAGTTGNKGGGKDFLSGYNVHSIALQIPIAQVDTTSHTIGVWSSTDRQNVTVNGQLHPGWTQVSRLGEPLINEVVIPTGLKDLWNRTSSGPGRAVQEVLRDPDPGRRAEQAVQARRPGDRTATTSSPCSAPASRR